MRPMTRTPPPRAARRVVQGLVLLALAAGFAAPGRAAPPAPGTTPPAPQGLDDLGRLIQEAAARLDRLIAEAGRDPRERLVAEYLSYDTERMAKGRGRVTAEELVEWMTDAKAQFSFRESCAKALLRGAKMLGDVDLTQDKKKGSSTNRGYFMYKLVAPLLKKDDRDTRSLALFVLNDLYGRMLSEEDIAAYNLDDKGTWNRAVSAWVNHLRKRG